MSPPHPAAAINTFASIRSRDWSLSTKSWRKGRRKGVDWRLEHSQTWGLEHSLSQVSPKIMGNEGLYIYLFSLSICPLSADPSQILFCDTIRCMDNGNSLPL